MTRAHFTHSYLLNPQHPVTVNLIGVGGTGSQVLSCLVRIDMALAGLGHPGLFVRVFDPDRVEPPNVGRQLFMPSELGLNKAVALVSRINAGFGLGWEAVPDRFPESIKSATQEHQANIFLTCTDNITSRYELAGFLKAVMMARKKDKAVDYLTPLYWCDFGNTQRTGQAVIGTIPEEIKQPSSEMYEAVGSLPLITDMDGYNNLDDRESGPSCSLAEALEKQDLFINSTLAQLGCNLLWKMFRHGMIEHRGLYLNLETMTVNPMVV
jgi:PRTRC genetic system ThiF family protein